jgi:hypothetical protein
MIVRKRDEEDTERSEDPEVHRKDCTKMAQLIGTVAEAEAKVKVKIAARCRAQAQKVILYGRLGSRILVRGLSLVLWKLELLIDREMVALSINRSYDPGRCVVPLSHKEPLLLNCAVYIAWQPWLG